MKKIIAIILALSICFSLLPTAFAANFGKPAEKLWRGKTVCHVGDDIELLKQSLVETLDEALSMFESRERYADCIWNEAQTLYKEEAARIYTLSELEDLVEESIFGYMPNETTMEVYFKISALAQYNKTLVRSYQDLTVRKKALLAEFKKIFKDLNDRSNYNDFYWDQLMLLEERATDEVKTAKTFADFGLAQDNWEYAFEDMELDPEFCEPWEYVEKDVLTKSEMDDYIDLRLSGIWDKLDGFVKEGYSEKKVYSDKVYAAIDKLQAKMEKVNYAREAEKIFAATEDSIYALAGVEVNTEKTPVTHSFLKRWIKKIDALRYSYYKEDYSESSWYEIEDLFEEAQNHIWDLEYQEDISEKFLKSLKKDLNKIPTLSKELSQTKKNAVTALKRFAGSKKYDQTKVKKLLAAGLKKIAAAKTPEQVIEWMDVYVNVLERTVKTFKITTAKSGSRIISKSGKVAYGRNYTVKLIPAAGWKIVSVTVDGKAVKLKNAYTFKKVTKPHTIKVTFGK